MLYEIPNSNVNPCSFAARQLGSCLALLFAVLAAQPSVAVEAQGQAYTVSAEDVLEISVWKEDDLQREVVVRPDGGITFPLVGEIEAAGKTPRELEVDITQRLETYIPDAVVTVSVVQLRGLRIYVTGKVRSPGQYEVGRYIDILQALTLAGGLTPFANHGDIRVIRREDGREVVYKFDYSQVEKGRKLEQNIVLQADDIVVVP